MSMKVLVSTPLANAWSAATRKSMVLDMASSSHSLSSRALDNTWRSTANFHNNKRTVNNRMKTNKHEKAQH